MTKRLDPLQQVPDFINWNKASAWIREGRRAVQQLSLPLMQESEIIIVGWGDIALKKDPLFGFYPSLNWRKWLLSIYLADLLSYPNPTDQVTFDRLLFAMHAFPQGFRSFWVRLSPTFLWPIGYTGWFPMAAAIFELFKNHPDKVASRTVIPSPHERENNPYLYLFNYSVAPPWKKTALSALLLKLLKEDVESHDPKGVASIIVSEDGARVANRFQMTPANCSLPNNLGTIYVT